VIRWEEITKIFLLSLINLLFLGCSSISSNLVTQEYAESDRTFILKVPVINQKNPECCGRVSLAMVMGYWTEKLDEAISFATMGVCPKGGFSGKELKNLAISHGFQVYIFSGEIVNLIEHIKATRPIIVMIGDEGSRHYVVVNGYSDVDKRIIFIDPARGTVFMDFTDFHAIWTQSKRFAMLIVPKE